jgi:D-arginine dehydrogenase
MAVLRSFDSVPIVIVGAGVAGASTAAALARAGAGPGVILEREPIPGAHASGKNAGIACLVEFDPIVRTLAIESVRRIGEMEAAGLPILRRAGGLYVADGWAEAFDTCARALDEAGLHVALLDTAAAIARFPFLSGFSFERALHCADDGVIDIHALVLAYLEEARRGGFTLLTRTDVQDIRKEDGRVTGVLTSRGAISTATVVDAGGAWAGKLGRPRRLPMTPLRRHLFVSAASPGISSDAPLFWHVSDGFYLRPEGQDGLLLSPCDESPHPAEPPAVDPAAAELLAQKLGDCAPTLADLPIRSSWACLRTFAADRRPVIGADPELSGLFHVAGLGGFGMGTSWAVGEVAAALVLGTPVPFIDPREVAPERLEGVRTPPGPR